MRILFVVEHFPAVSETFVMNEVIGMLKRGHEVTVYALGKPSGEVQHPEFSEFDLEKITLPSRSVPQSWARRLTDALRCLPGFLAKSGITAFQAFNVRRLGRKAWNLHFYFTCLALLEIDGKFDCVHCHFGDKGLLAVEWRRMRLISGPITTVFHAHELSGLDDNIGSKLYSPLFKESVLLLPISERWKSRLIRWGADKDRVVVHHMGVYLSNFNFINVELKKRPPFKILSVGRLTEQKGYPYALSAVSGLIKELDEEVAYIIVGGGEMHAELIQLAEHLGISGQVVFAGPRDSSYVRKSMKSADAFLLPSVTAKNGFQEGIPVALMEAMASGVPVVSSIHSGIPELIEHNESGLLAEERAVETLKTYLFDLATRADLCERLSVAARKKVEREFEQSELDKTLEVIFTDEAKRSGAYS